MNTLAEFKKKAQIGAMLACTHHLTMVGRDEKGQIIFKDKDLGIRAISIVQSNAIALKTTKTDGSTSDSWLYFPKAKECKFVDGTMEVYEQDDRTNKLVKVLTYKFIN